VRRTFNAASAAAAIGPIEHGCEIYGISKGQFSLIEILEHVLDHTGPADVVISTWTAAGADLAYTHKLLTDGRVRDCRWLVDFSFPSRQPAYCQALRDRFGDGAIACTANHAKFILVQNNEWAIVLRTSMNLNWNRRLESFEISDDRELCDWLGHIVASTFAESGAGVAAAVEKPSRAQQALTQIGGPLEHRGIDSGPVAGVSRGGISYE
jgi:hypothetical protein